ncbi:chromate transport protein [Paraliobacillus ryukyuensis]|uniref:Chromate transporter n=1 Tax=Paraliobacillus ryukyuensis TaxID=200904 RepID=A0A366E882_9BACI|nr:chromate efflux transporter [Paraliobacillus ryukyuensis]RBO98295.1 chromate transporter [Paraliobacillus ryukyuensis]
MTQLKTLWEIVKLATQLGFTSFGGPIAHLGFFHETYVKRHKWLNEKSYADLVALCQFLPGPASSQVNMGIGIIRGGMLGGIVSFIGFTLPSVCALIIFANVLNLFAIENTGAIQGLKIVAVVVVAHAIINMGKKLTPSLSHKVIALCALIMMLLWQTTFSQIIVIITAAVIGLMFFKKDIDESDADLPLKLSKKTAIISLTLFFFLLFLLPLLREWIQKDWIAMFDSFYRSGALVFGGGHVVLPLLEREFVPPGFLTEQQFLTGYGAAQAVPGPLFTFAAYIGAVKASWPGGLLATFAIFLPAFLLIFGTLPFWQQLRNNKTIRGAFVSVNAAVVGILIAAFYQPIWVSTINSSNSFTFAAVLFSLLVHFKLPAWLIVVLGAIGGILLPL